MDKSQELLEQRIVLLERTLWRVNLLFAFLVLVVVALAAAAFREQGEPTRTLRANRIEVVNDKGEVVAVIDGNGPTLRVGSEESAHVLISAQNAVDATTLRASVSVMNPSVDFTSGSEKESVGASLSLDGANAMLLLGYRESPTSSPNLVWLAANPQNTWVRLEHGSGSRASLFAYDFGVSGLRVGKANAAGQAMPPSATLGVASAGPNLTMYNNDGALIYHAGAPNPDRDGR